MKTKQIEDIVENEKDVFEISDIEKILADKDVLNEYESKYPNDLYMIIFSSLTHEQCESEEKAKDVVQGIASHHKELNTILQRDIGLVVASLDYLTNITKILDTPKLIEENKSEILSEMATVDELTELYLRDMFDVLLAKEVSESKRSNRPLSLLMLDIDDFKKVNDTYGHQKGDDVLKSIGQLLNSSVREMDLVARYGGEELVVVMPNTTLNQASKKAEEIRENISKLKFDDFSVSISIGVAQTNKNINSTNKLIKVADEALYKAKNSGKNKVVQYS